MISRTCITQKNSERETVCMVLCFSYFPSGIMAYCGKWEKLQRVINHRPLLSSLTVAVGVSDPKT